MVTIAASEVPWCTFAPVRAEMRDDAGNVLSSLVVTPRGNGRYDLRDESADSTGTFDGVLRLYDGAGGVLDIRDFPLMSHPWPGCGPSRPTRHISAGATVTASISIAAAN